MSVGPLGFLYGSELIAKYNHLPHDFAYKLRSSMGDTYDTDDQGRAIAFDDAGKEYRLIYPDNDTSSPNPPRLVTCLNQLEKINDLPRSVACSAVLHLRGNLNAIPRDTQGRYILRLDFLGEDREYHVTVPDDIAQFLMQEYCI